MRKVLVLLDREEFAVLEQKARQGEREPHQEARRLLKQVLLRQSAEVTEEAGDAREARRLSVE